MVELPRPFYVEVQAVLRSQLRLQDWELGLELGVEDRELAQVVVLLVLRRLLDRVPVKFSK